MVSKLARDNYNKVTKAINDSYTTDGNQPKVKTYHQLQKKLPGPKTIEFTYNSTNATDVTRNNVESNNFEHMESNNTE